MDRPLHAYLDFCLTEREALNPLDCRKLEKCIEESDATAFRFQNTDIVLGANTTFKDLEEGKAPWLPRHAYFYPEYVDSILMSCVLPENIDEPVMKRGSENCFIQHRALEGHQKGVYSYEGEGDMQLFVVADYGHVKVSVSNETGAAHPFDLSAESTDALPAAVLQWEMPDAGKVIVTVENLSDQSIGFVVASN